MTTLFSKFWVNVAHPLKRLRKGYGLSIIIPFRRSNQHTRQFENFVWVKQYWRCQLPGAQIIVGKDTSRWYRKRPFSKAIAINSAVRRATGDVFVLTDTDCYIDTNTVLNCAEEIRKARRRQVRLWFIPYRKFFRLTDEASRRVLKSDPCNPYQFPSPPHECDEDSTGMDKHHAHHLRHQHHHHQTHWSGSTRRGHWYGAMIQIMPREAFELVGGWDRRFRGWGGEDHSAMRAMDTLYCRHKTNPNQVLHLWHPMMSKEGVAKWVDWKYRLWDNQDKAGNNGQLAGRYSRAFGDVKKMRALVNESRDKFIGIG